MIWLVWERRSGLFDRTLRYDRYETNTNALNNTTNICTRSGIGGKLADRDIPSVSGQRLSVSILITERGLNTVIGLNKTAQFFSKIDQGRSSQ